MACSSVVVVNFLVKPNNYIKFREEKWRAGPLRRRKDSWKALLRVIGGTSLLRFGHASRATVGDIKHAYGATSQ